MTDLILGGALGALVPIALWWLLVLRASRSREADRIAGEWRLRQLSEPGGGINIAVTTTNLDWQAGMVQQAADAFSAPLNAEDAVREWETMLRGGR